MTRFEPVFLAFALAASAAAPFSDASAAAAAPVTRAMAPSNTALLAQAAAGAARRLASQVPLTPGTRVGLRSETDGPLDADMREALLLALNARKISCVLLPAGGAGTTPTGAAAPAPGEAPPPANQSGPGGTIAGLTARAEAEEAFAALQAERATQAARADSLARAGGGAGAAIGSILPNAFGAPADLPVLTWRVQEARVDYVRQFRGGLLGAQRVERRARVDLALRLTPSGSDAVAWSATADTTLGDVVLRSELASLEDRTRPETRPTPPASGFGKVLEPALVVVLIAGLVSLFYQNRP